MEELGMDDEWHVCEVLGLDDDCLGFVPKPCVGVIVAFERTKISDNQPGDDKN